MNDPVEEIKEIEEIEEVAEEQNEPVPIVDFESDSDDEIDLNMFDIEEGESASRHFLRPPPCTNN